VAAWGVLQQMLDLFTVECLAGDGGCCFKSHLPISWTTQGCGALEGEGTAPCHATGRWVHMHMDIHGVAAGGQLHVGPTCS
jgi:hypothetical protein